MLFILSNPGEERNSEVRTKSVRPYFKVVLFVLDFN